jgi:hypothetical protein
VIIIALVIGLASTSNYVVTKNAKKTDNIFSNFNNQVISAVNYCIIKNLPIASCTGNITDIFSNYTQQNTNDNFNLTIFYGNISSGEIKSITSYPTSSGSENPGLGIGNPAATNNEINYTATAEVYQLNGKNYINVIINGVIYPTPVLSDNNFIAIMITGSGGNTYVLTNQNN